MSTIFISFPPFFLFLVLRVFPQIYDLFFTCVLSPFSVAHMSSMCLRLISCYWITEQRAHSGEKWIITVTDYLRLFTLYEQVSCISHCWWPFWVPSLILACLSCLSVVKIKYPDTSSLPREGRLYLALTHGWSLQSIVAGLLKWQELGAPARKKEL